MAVTLALDSEQEQQLRRAARVRGTDADTLLQQVVREALARLAPPEAVPPPRRVLGLHAGQIWVSDDFDAPLPDEFWTGGE